MDQNTEEEIEHAEEALEQCHYCCCEKETTLPTCQPTLFSSGNFEKHYAVGRILGKGGFGIVYAGIRLKDKKRVAIKHIAKVQTAKLSMLNGVLVPSEVALLCAVKHVEGVVELLDYFERKDSFIIVMERPENCKDLFDFISEKGWLTETKARGLFKQIVETVLQVQHRGVFHRDIKDENILVDVKNGKTKLIDFGSGVLVEDAKESKFDGTLMYSPPEWIMFSRYIDSEATTWSMGILLYTMLCGDLPFLTEQEICDADIVFARKISLKSENLIRSCLRLHPRDRMKVEDILHHPWLKEEDFFPRAIKNSYEEDTFGNLVLGRRKSNQI